MKKKRINKNFLRFGMVLVLIWLTMVTLVLFASAATGSGQTPNGNFTWNWKTSNDGTDAGCRVSAENPTDSMTDDGVPVKELSITIVAKSSICEDPTCGDSTPAAPTTTTATVKNNTGSTIKIESVTSENGIATWSFSEEELAHGDTFDVYITATPANDKITTPQESSDIVTITYTIVQNVKVTYYGADGVSYTHNEMTLANSSASIEESVAAGSTVTLPAAPSVSNGTFIGWRLGHDGSLNTAGATVTISKNISVYPVIVTENQVQPFTVNGVPYYYWTDAVYAAKNGGTVILNQNYTLPTTLKDNGESPSGSIYMKETDEGLNFILPSDVKLLIPYGDEDTGSFTSTPENYLSKSDANSQFVASGISGRNFVFRTLTVPSGVKIDCYGQINANGQRQNDGQTFTGVTLGGYGHISLQGATDEVQLAIRQGAKLYCYGYVTGTGMVRIEKGGALHELIQICDWPGGSNASTWKRKAKENQSLFLLSQYYVQNVESDLRIDAGATAHIGAVVTMSYIGTTPVSTTFIGSSDGLFRLSGETYLIRRYDEDNDRMHYYSYQGTIDLCHIAMTLSGTDLNSADYILPLSNNISVTVGDGSTVNVGEQIALMPGSELTIAEGGTVNLSGEIYIVDVADWSSAYFYYNIATTAGIVNTSPNIVPLPYVATKNNVSPRATKLVKGYYIDAINATASGQLVVNGTLNVSGAICATTGASPDNAISSTGAGKIVFQSTPINGTLKAGYNTISTISTNPAKLKNADGTYLTTSAGTYYYAHGLWHKDTEPVMSGEVTTSPTCETEGYTSGNCSLCGDIDKYNIIDALGHLWDHACDTDCNREGCDQERTITHTYDNACDADCNVCGAERTPSAHKYVGKTTTTATCISAGKQTYTCSVCGHTYDKTIPATGEHDYKNTVTAPTCTEDGYTTNTCSVCGDTYISDTVTKKGHTEVIDEAKAPTCTATGLTEGKHCSVCDKVIVAQTEVAALGHKYEAVVTAPTCTKGGYTTYTCSACGDNYMANEVAASGHKYSASVTSEPTCTEKGEKTYTCSACSDSYTEEVDANGHTEVIVPAVAPTCTDTGLNEGKKCSVCGTVTVAQTTVDALGHTEGETVVENNVAADC